MNRLQKQNPGDVQAAIIKARTQIKLQDEKEAIATIAKVREKAPPAAQPFLDSEQDAATK